MKTIRNTTHKPLSVPLPRGKKLRLGPLKTGSIASDDAEYPPLKKLLDAGEIEVVGEGSGHGDGGGGGHYRGTSMQGHTSGGGRHRSGDR